MYYGHMQLPPKIDKMKIHNCWHALMIHCFSVIQPKGPSMSKIYLRGIDGHKDIWTHRHADWTDLYTKLGRKNISAMKM